MQNKYYSICKDLGWTRKKISQKAFHGDSYNSKA